VSGNDTLARLAAVIDSRRGGDPDKSYVARLFSKGGDAIFKKVGEEATEVVLAARAQTEERLTEETADLLYHVLVALEMRGVPLARVMDELRRRRSAK
jgi:phosphoribosyl-ATP pyrophosphohydrolase